MLEHEHNEVDLWSKNEHNEIETDEDDYDDDDVDFTKQDFRSQCSLCAKEINWFHRYYYKCDQCHYSIHKFCAELPETLQHPYHICHHRHLILNRRTYSWKCDICRTRHTEHEPLYRCPECWLYIDLHCAMRYLKTDIIHHPSHIHPLVRVAKEILCECDACGKEHKGVFYQCATCPISLIHGDCAFLPKNLSIQQTTNDIHSHTHPLTLAYSFVIEKEDDRYDYTKCRVCNGIFLIDLYGFMNVTYADTTEPTHGVCGKCIGTGPMSKWGMQF
ncbi:DC1, C1-like, zinc finger, RING/FYVE/PHD-type containing protein [Tanacetum coccineum]